MPQIIPSIKKFSILSAHNPNIVSTVVTSINIISIFTNIFMSFHFSSKISFIFNGKNFLIAFNITYLSTKIK
ncbi:hypothetical protein SDC9_107516 [bioreactor metagenome]|uniref:Uncharacterized protein n=1 Tax=bioreactor metagenome TaxID=1076179 RepID=A0A645BG15_9ZZZZ